MTVQELIDKLEALPEPLRQLTVKVETETEGGELVRVSAKIDGSKIWWEADQIILSSELYPN